MVWLFEGDEDSIENTIALRPNCHDKMYILDN
ncbi:restriction endonuclease [Rossellomorea sp. KS-H15a]